MNILYSFSYVNGCNCSSLITKVFSGGRFCNNLICNLCVSLIAEKIDLYVEYNDYEKYIQLGIPLFIGKNIYKDKVKLVDSDNGKIYLDLLNNPQYANIDFGIDCYLQNKEITDVLYNYLQKIDVKAQIMNKNPYKQRYGKNNDCYIHIRLGDKVEENPGIQYYLKALNKIQEKETIDKIYISSDTVHHEMIYQLIQAYPEKIQIFQDDEIKTIQFGSTNRHIILSHGTFSAVIGWLGYYSNIYYPEYRNMWHGDVFSIDGWNKIMDY